jgi:hypothetical protein
MTTTPDLRALCAALVKKLDELNCNFDIPSQSALIECANDALAIATPPPEPPTQEDLRKMFDENDWNYISPETFEDIACTVLQEWG